VRRKSVNFDSNNLLILTCVHNTEAMIMLVAASPLAGCNKRRLKPAATIKLAYVEFKLILIFPRIALSPRLKISRSLKLTQYTMSRHAAAMTPCYCDPVPCAVQGAPLRRTVQGKQS